MHLVVCISEENTMQWSNLTQCGLIFNIVSPVVHTFLRLVLLLLDSLGIEALILILEKVKNTNVEYRQEFNLYFGYNRRFWWTITDFFGQTLPTYSCILPLTTD